ncbi:hypothetical protein FB451DRAFT_1386569 [Mycena latifolia]|nr:hypothetical protein FB451DRAFT_1386569 [Mycena latifolia]
MSRRARLFSEFLGDADSRATISTVSSSVQDISAKRRKTSGLNSRFDRMVQTMNVTHRSPLKSARHRASSTSSASGSSVPKTPIDDYDEFHREAKLGTNFFVIKMEASSIQKKNRTRKIGGVFPWDQDSSSETNEAPPPPAPLPAWLTSTFSTLTTKHPLRLLLPRRTESEPTSSSPRSVLVEEENPFSFCPPADPLRVSPSTHVSPPPSAEAANTELSTRSTHTPPYSPSPAPKFLCNTFSLPDASFDDIPPFSTPGPGSIVSRSHSIPSVHFPQPHHVEYAPAFGYMPAVHPQESVNVSPTFVPPLHSTPIAKCLTRPSDSTNIALFPHDHNEHDGSTYHPSPNHSPYENIFTTPVRRPVYFDSPTEDPSDSDPLEPGYELESLDFKWEPFIQKPANEEDLTPAPKPSQDAPVISNSDDYYYEIKVDPEGEDDKDGQLYASINMEPVSVERFMSPGPFSFAPPRDLSPTAGLYQHQQIQKTTTTTEHPVPQFFAPAPGIFVSPLRNKEPPTSPRAVPSAQVGDDPRSSQASNDTIEDWEDDAAG